MSKIKVEEYGFQKVLKNDIEIEIPDEPMFYQEWNYRTIIGLFPQRATWSDNSVCALEVIKITDIEIRRTHITTASKALSDAIGRFPIQNKDPNDILKEEVIRHLKDFSDEGIITKEEFISAYDKAINKLNKLIYN